MIPQPLQDSIDQLFGPQTKVERASLNAAAPLPVDFRSFTAAAQQPARTCETCAFWKPIKPTDYRGDCELNVVYAAPAFNDGCAWHSQNASAPPLPGDGQDG